jgi:hypothetical protein
MKVVFPIPDSRLGDSPLSSQPPTGDCPQRNNENPSFPTPYTPHPTPYFQVRGLQGKRQRFITDMWSFGPLKKVLAFMVTAIDTHEREFTNVAMKINSS